MFVIPVAPSITEAMTTLVTPNEIRTNHSITVTCTVRPESDADMCVVMAMADGRTTREGKYSYIMRMNTSHAFYPYIQYICTCVYALMCIHMYQTFYITEFYTHIELTYVHT